jgi:hypothetical protein
MFNLRKIIVFTLLGLAVLPLWGGTGRPSDGFLSFIILLGMMLVLLGILHLLGYIKKRIQELMDDIF